MKEIVLTQGKVALVDDEDYEYLSKFKWIVSLERGRYYAVRKIPMSGGRNVRMHRDIMNPPNGMDCDHRDHDGLNNQKYNLRVCTRSQNMQNSKGSLAVKGAYWNRRKQYWQSAIRYNGTSIHLGCFKTQEEAAEAYRKAAVRYFGEFASHTGADDNG